jgi:hypothetical protein
MRVVLPGSSMHELLYFMGFCRFLPGGPHSIFLPKASLLARDSLHRVNCPHLYPWVGSVSYGLPADLKFDLDLRSHWLGNPRLSYPAKFSLACGEWSPSCFRPFMERHPAAEVYGVISRELGHKNSLFPWRKVCEHYAAAGTKLVFWGSEVEYRHLVAGVDTPIEFCERQNLQELHDIMVEAAFFIGTQGEALCFSEALGLPQVVEVSLQTPGSITPRPASWAAIAGKAVLPDGAVIEDYERATLPILDRPGVEPPRGGWRHPGIISSRVSFDLTLFSSDVKRRLSLPNPIAEVREQVLHYTAAENPGWAYKLAYSRLFHTAFDALSLAGSNLPLTEYLPPPNIARYAACAPVRLDESPPV